MNIDSKQLMAYVLKERIKPRLYQQLITNTASNYNSLVVLPTGLGKTLIAEMMTIHRLELYKGSKVLFLAPTKPLVQQHLDTFKKDLLVEEERLVLFTGYVKPEKRAELWKNADIIFSTPQGMENDIISNRINLKDVSLIIFDEAHRATGDYSYVFVAEQYEKQSRYQRILALTASPGADKETIRAVCDNLKIEKIEVRSNDSLDVKSYIQELDLKFVKVKLTEEITSLHKNILSLYNTKIEELGTLGFNKQQTANKITLLKAQAYIQAKAARGQRDYESLRGMSLIAEALKIQHALELVETQGISSLKKYLERLVEQSKTSKVKAVQNLVKDIQFKTALVKTRALYEAGVEHPKLREIKKQVLRINYNDKNAKIIIFNQYRDQAVKIKEAMDSINVSSKIFVGQMKKGDTGMNQKEQKAILSEFRNDEFSCLIATSVAEEGLDIPSVDYVIFYEPIPSAVRTVQRRGRTGRLSKGNVTILVAEGTRDEGYRWAAYHKEKKMYRVLEDIKKEFNNGFNEKPEKKKGLLSNFVKDSSTDEQRKTVEEKNKLVIIADHREKSSGVLKQLLNDEKISLRLEQLQTGDYLLSERVVIEFKRVPDFVDSIIDGRLFSQLRGLRKYRRPIIVVEGEEDIFSQRKIHPNAILGMMAAVTVSYNIPILFTKNSEETANLFKIIAKREQEAGEKNNYQSHNSKPVNDTELQEYFVSGLPGIGNTLAKPLLEKLGSIKNIVNASEEELTSIDKIGPKKAKRIKELFEKKYDPSQ